MYTRAHIDAHSSFGYTTKTPMTVRALCMAGAGQILYVNFRKKSHPIRPVEGLKRCIDFLCNTGIT